MYRLLAGTSLVVTSNTVGTRYLSFLYQSGQEAGATIYQMLDLYNGNTADANRTFAAGLTQNGGNTGSEYDFGVNEAYSSTGVAADTAVHLFVVKFELSDVDFSDSVTVWIDPTLGAGEPAGGITVSGQNIAFDRLSISSYSGGNSAAWDEIRWSTNFDGVNFPALVAQMQAEEAKPRTKAEVIALLKERGEETATWLESLSDDFLAEQFTQPGGATATKSRFEMIMGMKEHEMHHRGQLSAYVRAAGGKVPSIYGPSADTAVATA